MVETFIVRGESIGPKPCSNFSQTSLFLTASEYLKKDIHESYVHAPWHPPTIQLKEQHASYAKRTQARHIRVGLFRGDPLIKKKFVLPPEEKKAFYVWERKKMSLDWLTCSDCKPSWKTANYQVLVKMQTWLNSSTLSCLIISIVIIRFLACQHVHQIHSGLNNLDQSNSQ